MNELVRQISRDLEIYPCDNETDEQYGNRVIYCAMVAWTKVQILSISYNELNKLEKYPYASKRYICERIEFISEGLLDTISYEESWGYIDVDQLLKKELSKYILEKLIFCYQISYTRKSQWLTLSPERTVFFKENELVLGGAEWNSSLKDTCSVGLGAWRNKKNEYECNYKEVFNIPKCSLRDYYKSLEKNAIWQLNLLDDEYEYFSGGTGLWHSKAWRKVNKVYIPNGISLLRKSDEKYKYILLWHRENEVFTAKLDEWYYNEKEIKRIMYALEYYRGKPAQFKAKRKGNMIELHCHSELPNAENRILLLASWPKRTFNDSYLRIIPEFVWSDIEEVLSGLGIQVVFE